MPGFLFGALVRAAVTPTTCDPDLGCGAGCSYACPFGFPCDTPKDCLSGSCTGGFCDTGKSAVKTPTTSHTWELTTMDKSLSGFQITKDTYGETNRAVVKDPAGTGQDVLRILYPANSFNPSGRPRGGTGFYAQPLDLTAAKVVSFEFQIYFAPGFNFVKGGKLPGLYGIPVVGGHFFFLASKQWLGGRESCSGGDPATDCFSTRYMFRTKGAGEVYLYVNADTQVDAFCKIPPLTVCNGDYGNSVGRGAFTFKTGQWQSLLQRITLNTPGKADGRVQVMYNGQEVIDFNQVNWRSKKNVGFLGLEFETFFGGADKTWATPKDQFVYFKGLSIHWE
ncbi:hypothetical protein DFS34DRAFT_683685 [Phlyctochytrium arcticum]|nr:hypothetical protein DFS34DRAFT_683685 [Phlyctochytrium arcticum]